MHNQGPKIGTFQQYFVLLWLFPWYKWTLDFLVVHRVQDNSIWSCDEKVIAPGSEKLEFFKSSHAISSNLSQFLACMMTFHDLFFGMDGFYTLNFRV